MKNCSRFRASKNATFHTTRIHTYIYIYFIAAADKSSLSSFDEWYIYAVHSSRQYYTRYASRYCKMMPRHSSNDFGEKKKNYIFSIRRFTARLRRALWRNRRINGNAKLRVARIIICRAHTSKRPNSFVCVDQVLKWTFNAFAIAKSRREKA